MRLSLRAEFVEFDLGVYRTKKLNLGVVLQRKCNVLLFCAVRQLMHIKKNKKMKEHNLNFREVNLSESTTAIIKLSELKNASHQNQAGIKSMAAFESMYLVSTTVQVDGT